MTIFVPVNESSNIRIARNTLIIYFRMAITIVVGLIASRLVLQALGASDVGLYSAVGSAVAIVTVITSSLTVTTQRFMNIELGKPDGNPNRMFNICYTVHLAGAVVIFLLLETIGLWYIHYKLNVPPGKESDAMFVFQVSTLVACLGISNVPFQSMFNVHERFLTIAIVDIVNVMVKLGAVIALLYLRDKVNGLRAYALMMSLMVWISFVVYRVLCHRNWPETVRWSFVRDRSAYKDVLSFSNYNLLSAVSVMARGQGSNILINAFFGTTVNAAFYYATTVQSYVDRFLSNFDIAASPQIIQNIGSGNESQAIRLTSRVSRICILLFLIIFFPLWSELPFILRMWLGSGIPDQTLEMCRWTLVVAAVASTSAGIIQIINAYGRIKWYKILGAVLFIACLPVGWFLFHTGHSASSIIVAFVVADILTRIGQFALLRVHFRFPVGRFLRDAYLRPLGVVALMFAYLALYRLWGPETTWARLLGIVLTLTVVCLAAFFIGLTGQERFRIRKHLYRRWNAWSWDHCHKMRINWLWKKTFGRRMAWKDPQDLNEKIQWLICNTDTSAWTQLSDKLQVREYVASKGLGDLLVPLLGSWERSADIPYESLPERFVLKCNHDSHSTHIVDPSTDRAAVGEALDAALAVKLGYKYGETFYNPIPPRILAEEYLDSGSRLPVDYKVWCLDGKPYCIFTCSDREDRSLVISVYTPDWQPWEGALVYSEHFRPAESALPRPACLDGMLRAAETLAAGFPEVRVDFYEVRGRLYFGEMTFASASGMMTYFTPEFLREMGSRVTLPRE